MKTIICGPPHSGKSVFISNLVKLLPSGYYVRINANGDGEGTWSNNPDQDDVMMVRIKGTNSDVDFQLWRHLIECANKDIVIVDIGGRLQEDKAPLFAVSDNFIVVSNNNQMADEWIKFGTSHGCACIGTILSELGDLHESVISTDPFVHGVMSGLERGHNLVGSLLLNAIAESIIDKSGFKGYKKQEGINLIDMYDIGIKLGMSHSWKTKNGIDIHNVWYQAEKAALLYSYLKDYYKKDKKYQIYGARSLWVSCLTASCLTEIGVEELEVCGLMTDNYIRVSPIAISNKESNSLSVTIKENEDYVLLSVKIPTIFAPKNCQNASLPSLNANKKFLLSGRIPSWLAMSIILSYDNKEKYIHNPGIGFIKIEDRKTYKHGEIITISELSDLNIKL